MNYIPVKVTYIYLNPHIILTERNHIDPHNWTNNEIPHIIGHINRNHNSYGFLYFIAITPNGNHHYISTHTAKSTYINIKKHILDHQNGDKKAIVINMINSNDSIISTGIIETYTTVSIKHLLQYIY